MTTKSLIEKFHQSAKRSTKKCHRHVTVFMTNVSIEADIIAACTYDSQSTQPRNMHTYVPYVASQKKMHAKKVKTGKYENNIFRKCRNKLSAKS